MEDVVIVDAVRTAVGKFGGTLAEIPAHRLGSRVIAALMERTGMDPARVDEVIMGQVLTAGVGVAVTPTSSWPAGRKAWTWLRTCCRVRAPACAWANGN